MTNARKIVTVAFVLLIPRASKDICQRVEDVRQEGCNNNEPHYIRDEEKKGNYACRCKKKKDYLDKGRGFVLYLSVSCWVYLPGRLA